MLSDKLKSLSIKRALKGKAQEKKRLVDECKGLKFAYESKLIRFNHTGCFAYLMNEHHTVGNKQTRAESIEESRAEFAAGLEKLKSVVKGGYDEGCSN